MEFFNIVCKHIFSEEARKCRRPHIFASQLQTAADIFSLLEMFTTDPQTGLSYFTAGSLQPLYMFELFGLLLALAICKHDRHYTTPAPVGPDLH